MMGNKIYRLRDLIEPVDGRSLVVDTSRGLIFGALPGLEDFSQAVSYLLPLADGLVTSPGQARRLARRTQKEAALIVRGDWTNALRGDDFVLPPKKISYLPMLNPLDALDLGACALVMDFLLGFEEEIEAQCIKQVVNLSLQGASAGMPLLVDIQPIGPRVVLRDKAIELGVSYALEGGADGVIVPRPGSDSIKNIRAMCNDLPVWVAPSSLEINAPELGEILAMGVVGFWLDERLFTAANPLATLEAFRALLHPLKEGAE